MQEGRKATRLLLDTDTTCRGFHLDPQPELHKQFRQNLEWEPSDLLPLSISHQKEPTGALPGQNAEVLGGSFPFS